MTAFKLTDVTIRTAYTHGYGIADPRSVTAEAKFYTDRYTEHHHDLSNDAIGAILEIIMNDFMPPTKIDELEKVAGIMRPDALPALEIAAPPEKETAAPSGPDEMMF